MSMSKKHFEALAAEMRHNKPVLVPNMETQWKADVYSLASVCARFNPRFDRTRFLKACGVGEAK